MEMWVRGRRRKCGKTDWFPEFPTKNPLYYTESSHELRERNISRKKSEKDKNR